MEGVVWPPLVQLLSFGHHFSQPVCVEGVSWPKRLKEVYTLRFIIAVMWLAPPSPADIPHTIMPTREERHHFWRTDSAFFFCIVSGGQLHNAAELSYHGATRPEAIRFPGLYASVQADTT